jgi:phosphatidylglycerophosphate synthase
MAPTTLHADHPLEALVIVDDPGAADPRWPLVRIAGLPAIERNLMALRSVGVRTVGVACGPAEYETVAGHLAVRRADRRLPEVRVGVGPGEPHGAALVLDGRCVYHPRLLERLREGGADPTLYREDITTPEGRRRARRAIRHSLRKPTDGWFARTIDRSASLAISSLLAPFPVHPNAVTLGTLLVGVASGLLAARGTYWSLVAASGLFLLASVLDGVDGELARMKFQGSRTGQWLDTVCDDLTNAIYLTGLTVGAWRTLGWPWLLWTGVAAIALDVITVSFLYWHLVARVDAATLLAFEETILAPALAERGLAGLVARLQPFIKRDVYAPIFLVFALAGAAWLALPGTAVAVAITAVYLVRDFARPA